MYKWEVHTTILSPSVVKVRCATEDVVVEVVV